MKFVMLIANEEYQTQLEDMFHHLNCSATMIASTGDFLQYGEIIYLLGMEEEQADALSSFCERLFLEKGAEDTSHMRLYMMQIDQYQKCVGGIKKHDREGTESTQFSAENAGE